MKFQKNPTPQNFVGVGLRSNHIEHVLKNHRTISQQIGWFEVHSENYYTINSPLFAKLLEVRKYFPISLHSVSNSLGSKQKISLDHLKKLREIIKIIDPFLVSDHISWGLVDNKHLNDLLPLPYSKEALSAIAKNISIMQDFLKREILIENPSTYLAYKNCEFEETDFINKLTKLTGCKLLLDVNNIYVSAKNNSQFDAKKYIEKIDKKIVKEIHLAGHSKTQIFDGKNYKEILIDTHNNFVCDEVWKLYNQASARFKKTPTLIEWDQDLPEFKVLISEVKKAKKYAAK